MKWFCAITAAFLAAGVSAAEVRITVDAAKTHQTIEGFGASTLSWCDGGVDQLGAMRKDVIEAVYGQVKLTMGDIHCGPYEGVWKDPTRQRDGRDFTAQNDNDDPAKFNWAGFSWWRSDFAKTKLVDIARPMGFDNFCLRGGVNSRWGDPWLAKLKAQDRQRYLDEAAENVLAILVRWRDEYHIVPRWHQLFNEPLSGNREVAGGTTKEIVDLVRTVGKRMRAEGFDKTMLVVPSEETATKSLETAKAILDDPEAAKFVGAIGYHSYPYGSTYSSVKRILDASGAGKPAKASVDVRQELRDLAAKHGVQVWMTEVSHAGSAGFEMARGRAVHIHDEMLYADASSYWAMFNIYEKKEKDEDHVVIFDESAQKFWITGMGYAIGHYARWVGRGDVRVEAASSDPLVQVTAFADDKHKSISLVLINNSDRPADVSVEISGVTPRPKTAVRGEQSTAKAYWEALKGLSTDPAGKLAIKLPAESITSLGMELGK